MWTLEATEDFIRERIALHTAETPRPCTDEERWHQPDKWALMKKGQKKAIKLYEEKPENLTLSKDHFLEHRPGAYRRCEAYCPVAAVCPQNRATIS